MPWNRVQVPKRDKEGMHAGVSSACPGGMGRGTTRKCNQI